jgi:hypothetical protein
MPEMDGPLPRIFPPFRQATCRRSTVPPAERHFDAGQREASRPGQVIGALEGGCFL